ncbi:unnamed protein product [Parascedosporium putredinis]|uniref:RRM domain-containing protein n=1 Tax=Parascedosporium putredinis TaxID=1442378 RepID=A0A9P1H4J9_9PEZI|nr:unnamed protein product [Parascedosporium putredinis]CAI7998347.1 unnamed protein product [Parascedosporium putredinis]
MSLEAAPQDNGCCGSLLSFPTDVGAFGADDRISFSLQSKTYLAVADDGSEYEFNERDKTWAPVDYDQEDDDDLHSLHEAGDNGSALALDSQSRKRRPDPSYDDENPNQSRPQRPKKKAKAPPAPRQNTAVYVTGLPLDATVDEVYDLFSKKGA